MAGHSHFSTIKRKKEVTDKKRGQIFSKLSKMISVAVREKGADPLMNPKLKLAIEKAKSANMPKENIERAINQAKGSPENNSLEEITYEVYGPGSVAIIIEAISDNKNRTLFEIKQILARRNGKIVPEGSARWLFERKINQETKSPEWIAKQEIEITAEEEKELLKIIESLEENDSIQEIYFNAKLKN